MRHGRRITAMAVLAALSLPGAAAAEDAFIRIEAKRGAAAAAAAEAWRERFPDVVSVPLANGMTGIVLGPQTPAEAAARMARLKAEGTIPADSYLTGPGGEVPLSGVAGADAAADGAADGAGDGVQAPARAAGTAADGGDPAPGAAATAEAAGDGEADAMPAADDAAARPGAAAGLTGAMPDASPATPSAAAAGAGPDAATAAPAAAPDTAPRHIQLQATPGRISAGEALARWQRSFPGAQLWRIPGGWYAIALPAQPADRAEAHLAELKAAGRVPRDAFLASPAELGRLVEPQPDAASAGEAQATAGESPAPADADADAAAGSPGAATAPAAAEPAPPVPAVMPPTAEVQRALRWAGLYDGPLDGQSGPATRAAIDARIAATGGTASPAEAMVALIAEREAWRREVGLEPLTDAATGLTLLAPAAKLAFDRTERALSIYGPKDGSGAALILFAQPGGQQELLDMAGLVTALGWVPQPERDVGRGRFALHGANTLHVGHAEGRVEDGMVEGWVLIWPAADAENARRLAIEAAESFARTRPAGGTEAAAAQP